MLYYFSLSDHIRKKNCTKDPWCTFGLGELKEGIWKETKQLYDCLGSNPEPFLRSFEDEFSSIQEASLSPPAGLKNLGATCYLNVLIQVQ
jgi:uncharacterized UBP type Zn finger protein